MLQIPLIKTRSQKFSTVINNITYGFKVTYNSRIDRFHLDLSINNVPTLFGICLTPGVEMLHPFNSSLKYVFCFNLLDTDAELVYDNLGDTSILTIWTEAEVTGYVPTV